MFNKQLHQCIVQISTMILVISAPESFSTLYAENEPTQLNKSITK